MDLPAEATRLRLDVLAVACARALADSGVPHALIKGPSTSLWLYHPPRRYSDVDLLVPLREVHRAACALADTGLATARSGGVGEEASHSLLMHSAEGFEVDLHVSLPLVPTDGDRVWDALAAHQEPLVLDVGTVTALDETGRCLVLALHALANPLAGQATEDLRRARAATGESTWRRVRTLAAGLGVVDLLEAGLATVEGETVPLSRRARLHLDGAPAVALGLRRLADAPWRTRPRMLARELVPSRGFMAQATGRPDLRGAALVRAHLRRWRRLGDGLLTVVRSRRERQFPEAPAQPRGPAGG